MRIYPDVFSFKDVPRPVITIGTFDGVHVGHQKILSRLNETARKNGGESVLLTFNPHPRKILFPSQTELKLLNTLDEKTELLKNFGVQHLVIHPFTTEFSKLQYDDFVTRILVKEMNVNTLVIGYDHQFGHGRKGGFEQLQELSGIYGFEVEKIPEEDIDESAVSSTRIRKALIQGDIGSANQLLGYNYSFTGKVVEGKKLGRQLGFPTANLESPDPDKLVPANGIYAVKVLIDRKKLNGVLSIGNRPTFDNGPRSIEVHIFDFADDLYGLNVTVEFISFLRDELKFNSADDLVLKMKDDEIKARTILEKN